MSRLKSLYTSSPDWLKRVYSTIPFDWRAGSDFRRLKHEIRMLEAESPARIHEAHNVLIQRILSHAVSTVPRYKDIETSTGSPLEWLDHFPLTRKQDIQTNRDLYISSNPGEPTYWDNTGGSSGTPFQFLKNNSMYSFELAHIHSLWSRVGYTPRDCKITLRGRAFAGVSDGRRWAYNPIYNEIAVSTYHLDPETLKRTLREIKHFRPKFIHGYPSAISQFLQVVSQNQLPLPQDIQAALCGSEPLYPYQRELIRNTLGCRAFSWYGQSECVLLAGECEHSQDYHVEPLYGHLELLDQSGVAIIEPGIEGEIVATSLRNSAMPFIRYCTGDRGILADGDCPCGRSHVRLKYVVGREQHYVVTDTGVAVPVTAFVFGQHFRAFDTIANLQLEQNKPGIVILRIVRRANYSDDDEREFTEKMSSCVDGKIRIVFEYVDQIPTTSSGKTEFVIQRVPVPRSA